MTQTRSLCKKEEDKKNQPGDSSYATNILEICSKGTSYEDGCRNLQINMFSDISPSEAPPHTGGICLLGSAGEAGDLPLEAHQALIAEILGEKGDVSLEKDFVGPLLQYFGYQSDKSLEEGSSRWLSHEQKIEYVGGCYVFYDPLAGYMEGMGKDDEWSHFYFKE